jgi:hypothetical protein
MIGTFLAIEGVARARYVPPGAYAEYLRRAEASLGTASRDVLLFGTCLAKQNLDDTVLSGALGKGTRVHTLAAAGTTSLDWYIGLRDQIGTEHIDRVVVAYAPGDLVLDATNWQTQGLDLASWASVREMAWWNCASSPLLPGECVQDLYTRKASFVLRNRNYLANRVWDALGARWDLREPADLAGQPPPPGAPPAPPGPGAPGPSARDADPSQRGPAPVSPLSPTSANDARAVAQERAAVHYLQRFVTIARTADKPPLFIELAPAPGSAAVNPRMKAFVRRILADLRVDVVVPSTEGVTFEDDVHVTKAGRAVLTRAVVDALRTHDSTQENAPGDGAGG